VLEEVPELMPKWMRFRKRYNKKKGPKRFFKKSGKSEDASATVHQVYTVSNDGVVTHYLYSVAGNTRAQEWILD
jgi:transcriptional regulator of NAD metabolism